MDRHRNSSATLPPPCRHLLRRGRRWRVNLSRQPASPISGSSAAAAHPGEPGPVGGAWNCSALSLTSCDPLLAAMGHAPKRPGQQPLVRMTTVAQAIIASNSCANIPHLPTLYRATVARCATSTLRLVRCPLTSQELRNQAAQAAQRPTHRTPETPGLWGLMHRRPSRPWARAFS